MIFPTLKSNNPFIGKALLFSCCFSPSLYSWYSTFLSFQCPGAETSRELKDVSSTSNLPLQECVRITSKNSHTHLVDIKQTFFLKKTNFGCASSLLLHGLCLIRVSGRCSLVEVFGLLFLQNRGSRAQAQ